MVLDGRTGTKSPSYYTSRYKCDRTGMEYCQDSISDCFQKHCLFLFSYCESNERKNSLLYKQDNVRVKSQSGKELIQNESSSNIFILVYLPVLSHVSSHSMSEAWLCETK